jgi:hypothetical protein
MMMTTRNNLLGYGNWFEAQPQATSPKVSSMGYHQPNHWYDPLQYPFYKGLHEKNQRSAALWPTWPPQAYATPIGHGYGSLHPQYVPTYSGVPHQPNLFNDGSLFGYDPYKIKAASGT